MSLVAIESGNDVLPWKRSTEKLAKNNTKLLVCDRAGFGHTRVQ